jgi:hypothetical protein
MIDISMLTTFFGWTTTLNLAVLLLATVILTSLKGVILPIHKSMLGLSEDELQNMYVQYLAQYKIAFFVLSLMPYVALKIMGG